MKRIFTLLAASLFTVGSWAQEGPPAKPDLSPQTRYYLKTIRENTASLPEGYCYKKRSDGREVMGALIKVANATVTATRLKELDASVGTKAGDIWTVQVPVENIAAFAQTEGISYIQLDEAVVSPQLDVVRTVTRVDSVHRGLGLPMPYSGKNVVMGVIDFGFDYTHPMFYDTVGTRYRIRKVWELNSTGTPPTGYSYGREITDTNIIKTTGTDNARQTHGTGVTGIAAGSGVGSTNNRLLRGMAYDADLVFVGVRRDSIGNQWRSSGFSDFIDGVSYIFNYATSVGKPAVVNISWGSQSGPHDGTSLFAQACNNLSGAGKIIVMSAGNDGQERIHLSKTFTGTDTSISTFLTFSPEHYKRTWVDVWGEAGKTFCAKATLYHNGVAGATTNFVCINNQVNSRIMLGANGVDTCFVDFITAASEFNGRPRQTVSIYNKATDSVGIVISGTSGTIHMWDESYYYGYTRGYSSEFDSLRQPWARNGNTQSTVSDMGSAQSVLLVGAYVSKSTFRSINDTNYYYNGQILNGIASFSSRGPMADGRIKPDITAPGLAMATAVTSFDTTYTATGANRFSTVSSYQHPQTGKKYYYAMFTGTSASSPVAAGIVAMLLQVKPDLTPQQAKDVLFTTALSDLHTGVGIQTNPTNTWGHGKINAYGAVKKLVQQTGIYQFSGRKLDCVVYPNPGNGQFIMDYSGSKAEVLRIDVYNVVGARSATQYWSVSGGDNRRSLDLTALPQGVYIVKVVGKDGSVSMKVIKE